MMRTVCTEGHSSSQAFRNILVRDMIISWMVFLTESNFQLRAVISDNNSTNVGAYKDLLKMYPIQGKDYVIFNPKCHLSEVYLIYDTVHLVKNIRNNLLASRFFQIPEFSCITKDMVTPASSPRERFRP